ncbi:glycosyl hydrolase [uncultured Parabacteroides sp.]|uniref:glycosyl hydrolase n=1 Tax=uncultured Parabacteroides sp. TaxID=512312 RepID=UPI0025DC2318|nr:glycosyl hydrolase [uncultured Parabacteroides sp.]
MRKPLLKTLLCLSLLAPAVGSAQDKSALESGFMNPSEEVQTSVYWYWISGNISEEGVRKDLYSMKEAGINRAFIGNIGLEEVKTPYKTIPFGSEEWWKVLHAALKTATELGIEIGIFNSPGWSQSGGPWVKPEQAMRYLASVKAEVSGGKQVEVILAKPDKDFQDVKVIAFPSVGKNASRLSVSNTKVSSSPALQNLSGLLDGDKETALLFTEKNDQPVTIDFQADKPFTLRSLQIYPAHQPIQSMARLQVKENGVFRTMAEFKIDRFNANPNVGFDPYAPVVVSVPATTAGEFRLELSGVTPGSGLSEVVFSSSPAVERYPEKTLAKMFQTPLPYWHEYQWPVQPEVDEPGLTVDPDQVLDISSCLQGDRLVWKAPAGDWTILRTGMLPTGVTNSPADPEATGLETDKMSRKHIETHFEAYMGEIYRRIPAEDRKCWKVVVQDSYETGGQNFTDDFLREFQERYGYDPLPFLPAYEGYVVKSQDQSDRFLWDVRRLIADKIAYDYVGGLRDVCHKYGLTTWLENYGHWGFPGEFLQYGGQSDEIGGEFWSFGDLGNIENRAASSCGHIYGKQKISAESFTSGGTPFSCYPAMMKQRGDRFFTEGINNTLLHVYISQPTEEREPGVNAWFSSEFNRLNTWYPQMDLFTSYLKRVNYMLQQGLNIADVAYFIGEDAPKMTGITEPELPKGYQFDYINAEVIERDLFVKDGLLTLPHGTQYRILVLPKLETMRPELLGKIKRLVEDGAVVLGPAPQRSPSMQHYGRADRQVKAMADELWGGLDGQNVKAIKRGKGELLYGMSMAEALQHIGCVPDCGLPADAPVLYGHRSAGDTEIYFISNQKEETIEISPELRVRSRQPELWDAMTGRIRPLPAYRQTATGTVVPLKLHPYESALIVFRKPAQKPEGTDLQLNYPAPQTLVRLDAPWKVSFEAKRRGPATPQVFTQLEDLTRNENFDIRHYSGTIWYETDFVLKKKPDGDLFLNLNDVGVMAKVKINGQYAGGVWTAPYRVNITDQVKKGKNKVEVEVVTTWMNRLIGDSGLPQQERKTWAPCNIWKPTDALQKSGLIGPVCIESVN